jgi:hypothetical protein
MPPVQPLISAHPLIDGVLEEVGLALGADLPAYRGHVYRVLNLSHTLLAEPRPSDTLALAAVCHDLGIWSAATFDYLEPSQRFAENWARARGLRVDLDMVGRMIALHHKLRPCAPEAGPEAESFRRADLIDLSLGLIRFGLPRAYLRELRAAFPNAGFHRCLARVGLRWWLHHPARPLPMVRW